MPNTKGPEDLIRKFSKVHTVNDRAIKRYKKRIEFSIKEKKCYSIDLVLYYLNKKQVIRYRKRTKNV